MEIAVGVEEWILVIARMIGHHRTDEDPERGNK
jgi:hypothetical protein